MHHGCSDSQLREKTEKSWLLDAKVSKVRAMLFQSTVFAEPSYVAASLPAAHPLREWLSTTGCRLDQ